MPQSLPSVTASLSVLSIQRVAPAASAASATQRDQGRMPPPQAIGNRAAPRRSGKDVQQIATPSGTLLARDTAETLTAEENQRFEACSWQLRWGWRSFQNDLVTHALSNLDPAWPPEQRQIFELSARQLLLDTAPSALLAQPVFAQHLSQPGCMRSLLTAMMKWLEAHTDVLEQRDIARTGTSDMTAGKHAYLAGMASLLSGPFEQALANKTLFNILNALHEEASALRELEAMQNVSGAQWAAWAWAQGLKQRQ